MRCEISQEFVFNEKIKTQICFSACGEGVWVVMPQDRLEPGSKIVITY